MRDDDDRKIRTREARAPIRVKEDVFFSTDQDINRSFGWNDDGWGEMQSN